MQVTIDAADQTARVLKAVADRPLAIKQISRATKLGPTRTWRAVRRLTGKGLIEGYEIETGLPGRKAREFSLTVKGREVFECR